MFDGPLLQSARETVAAIQGAPVVTGIASALVRVYPLATAVLVLVSAFLFCVVRFGTLERKLKTSVPTTDEVLKFR